MQLNVRKSAFPFNRVYRGVCGLIISLLSFYCGVLAAQTVTDDALFWRVGRGDQLAGYVLGTIHSEDPRVLEFSEDFISQLTSCQRFAMEMVPDLSTLRQLGEYMQFADQDTLRKTLGTERYDQVMEVLSAYQVPDDWKTRMKVWAIMMTLSVPAPNTGLFMDLALSLRAAGAGLEVKGLETLEQQMSFLESMPMEYQLVLLDKALADYQQVENIHTEMVDSYLDGNLSAMWQFMDEEFDSLDPAIREYFVGMGINARNRGMLENLLPLLDESQVFVAVGAYHLAGEEGLVALLRTHGFTLTPLGLPFDSLESGTSP